VSSVAPTHAAGSDPAEHSQKLFSTVKQAREAIAVLQSDYGIPPAFVTTPLPSNATIAEEIKGSRHKLTPVTLEPPLEEVLGTALKQARESFAGHVPGPLPPKTLSPASEIAAAPLQSDSNPVPNRDAVNRRKPRPKKQYRSCLKRHIKNCLTNNPDASAAQVCGHVDEQGLADDDFPATWMKNGNRELTVAYKDEKVRPRIDSMISKVKHDLRT